MPELSEQRASKTTGQGTAVIAHLVYLWKPPRPSLVVECNGAARQIWPAVVSGALTATALTSNTTPLGRVVRCLVRCLLPGIQHSPPKQPSKAG